MRYIHNYTIQVVWFCSCCAPVAAAELLLPALTQYRASSRHDANTIATMYNATMYVYIGTNGTKGKLNWAAAAAAAKTAS